MCALFSRTFNNVETCVLFLIVLHSYHVVCYFIYGTLVLNLFDATVMFRRMLFLWSLLNSPCYCNVEICVLFLWYYKVETCVLFRLVILTQVQMS